MILQSTRKKSESVLSNSKSAMMGILLRRRAGGVLCNVVETLQQVTPFHLWEVNLWCKARFQVLP